MPVLEVFRLSIPLVRAITTAAGTVDRRDVIIVAYQAGGSTGWGEYAPWPGQTAVGIDAAWGALVDDPAPCGAAYDLAVLDHDARRRAEPLWRQLGGLDSTPVAAAAVGLTPDHALLLDRVAGLIEHGFRAVKLKIAPGAASVPLEHLRSAFPSLAIGVDANAGFDSVAPDLTEVALLQPDYVEQPFAPERPELARQLRETTGIVVVADEAIRDEASARATVAAGAADVIALKLGRLGPAATIRLVRWAEAEGVGVKMSGLFETSLGRGHTLAHASIPAVSLLDFAPASAHLADDIAIDPWQIVNGFPMLRHSPGTGVTVDRDKIQAIASRYARREIP